MLYSLLCAIAMSACSAHSYSCVDSITPITVTAPSYITNFPKFGSHHDSAQFLVDLTTRRTSDPLSPFSGAENVTQTFDIDASYCVPTHRGQHSQRRDTQILSHGLGFDRSYWEFGGRESEYNYVRAAADTGYATISWSRPGNGKSSGGDPYDILQASIEAAVLVNLTKDFRSGNLHKRIPRPTGRVLHIGHSHGSVLSNAIIATNPELSDGIVLTGLSHNSTWSLQFAVSTNFHLAKENQPERFGNLSTGVLTWGDSLALQYSFFKQPHFDIEVLTYAEANKWPFTIGELISQAILPVTAPQFTAPVLVSDAPLSLVAPTEYTDLMIIAHDRRLRYDLLRW
jgi:pimeloyl-ACP methyl ester carboxylesterase